MSVMSDYFSATDIHPNDLSTIEDAPVRESYATDTGFSETFSSKLMDTEKRLIPQFDKVNDFDGKIILDFDNTIDIDSDYTLGETAVGWLNDMATSGVDAYLVTGNGNQEAITEAILEAVEPENREYWQNLLDNKAYYGAGDKSDEYQDIIGDSNGSKWMLVDDSSKNVKDFLEETGGEGFVYEPNDGYATYEQFGEYLNEFVAQLSGEPTTPGQTPGQTPGSGHTGCDNQVHGWYEKHNDEAGRGRDNEMSKREVVSFSQDDSLTETEKAIANFVLENRKRFDTDGNGRLNREEFLEAVTAAKAAVSGEASGNEPGATTGTSNPSIDQWYEHYNDEAGKGRDNEMSKREVRAFAKDSSLSEEEQRIADFVFENMSRFDTSGNGRLNREEFLQAVNAASGSQGPSPENPTDTPTNDPTGSPSDDASQADQFYERYNNEAAEGKDNEMSKREIQAFKNDQSLSSADRALAGYIYDNRKLFDTDANGRLSREEFIKAYDAAVNGDIPSQPPQQTPAPSDNDGNDGGSNTASGTSLNGNGETGSIKGSKRFEYTAKEDVTLVVSVNASHGQDPDDDKLPEISGLGETYSAGNNDIGLSVSTPTLSKGESVSFTIDTNGGKGAYMIDTIDGHYRVTDDASKKDGSWGLSADSKGDLYGYFGAYDDGATSSSTRAAEKDGFELKNGGDVLIWKVGKDSTMDPDLVSNEGKGGGGNKGQLMLTFDEI